MNAEASQTVARDRIDARIVRWADEIPDLDLEVEAITQRVHHLRGAFERVLAEVTEQHGRSVGEYKALMMLRGAGPPYELSPSKLAGYLSLSTGAMTNRLDNLERAGLVRRLPDPDDRRSVRVALTDDGHRVWDAMAGQAASREALIVSALDDDEKVQLNALLRRLVLAADRVAPKR